MMGIKIVGLGPGDSRLMTRQAWEALLGADTVYLRTDRHPAVNDLPASLNRVSFDAYYEEYDTFDDIYERIVEVLISAGKQKPVIYAVPGHPFVGESTVTALVTRAEQERIPLSIVPGLSFVEPVLAAVKMDGLSGLQLFDAIEMTTFKYPPVSADLPLLLGQVYSRLLASELKMVLSAVFPDEHAVFLVHAAGTKQEIVESLPLYAIDRSRHIDHLTSLFVPPLPYKATLPALAETVAVLRSPGGCPWDQEQTPRSMRATFLEEVAEILDALDAGDQESLREELGDLLYHLVMQVQLAAESGAFSLSDVIAGIEAKLKRRHPHVWGDWEVADSAEVLRNWELLKRAEKNNSARSLLDSVPKALAALAQSQKIQGRVREVGFDWPAIDGVYEKLTEELEELKAAESADERNDELGDALFVMANLAQWLGIDAESALREANSRFSRRFRALESLLAERGLQWEQLDLPALDALWEEVKETLAKGE